MLSINDRNRRLGFGYERVGECHTGGARADDQVVNFDD
jgi:hypothetical protein